MITRFTHLFLPLQTVHRLTKISKIENFFLDEIDQLEKLAIKMKKVTSSVLVVHTVELLLTVVVVGSTSIPVFC